MFSCYIFVNIAIRDYYAVLYTPVVIRYITFEGKAVAINEKQIQLINNLLEQDYEIEELPGKLEKGTLIEIKAGPLLGLTGELVNYANNQRVVLRIEEINKALLVNIPLQYLKLTG
jgi:transcriptional antiterminator RfaH